MLAAGEATGDSKFTEYTTRRIKFIADLAPHFRALFNADPQADNALRSVVDPRALDDSGSMCAAMIRALRAGTQAEVRPLIDNYINYISAKQLRLADGTLARNRPQPNTLWLDDLYMSVPALAEMGKLSGERKYFDDAVKQILQFSQRMFNRNKGLYMHGWVQGMDVHPEFHWARANGWALLATVDLLDVLPENHPSRAAIIDLLRAHIRGLAACQSASGFWHQLLDRSDSYLETSATAIYTYGIAHAINKGWIDPIAQGPMVISGWNAVSTKVNTQGQVEGTCVGTGRKEIFKLPFSRSAASRLGKSGLNLSLVAACRAVCICAFKTFSRRRHGQRARPGAGKCFAASSSTRTQSSISPLSGGTNSRSPRLSNSPAACARPVRGLNHHAFTFEPVMTSSRTLNGLPAGV
jgi:rhamnogalacturonyl hydrolase YesR